MPTDEDDQNGHFFFNHPEGGLKWGERGREDGRENGEGGKSQDEP